MPDPFLSMDRRGQLHIMQNTAILILLIVIISIGLVGIISYQIQQGKALQTLRQDLLLEERIKVARNLPEIVCTENGKAIPGCYDLYKIQAFSHIQDQYYAEMLGYTRIILREFEIGPSSVSQVREHSIYARPKPEFSSKKEFMLPCLLKESLDTSYCTLTIEVYQ